MDDPDQATAGCLTALLRLLVMCFLFDWAAGKDRQWLAVAAQQRDDDWLRQIALHGAQLSAARWNAVEGEFNDEDAGPAS